MTPRAGGRNCCPRSSVTCTAASSVQHARSQGAATVPAQVQQEAAADASSDELQPSGSEGTQGAPAAPDPQHSDGDSWQGGAIAGAQPQAGDYCRTRPRPGPIPLRLMLRPVARMSFKAVPPWTELLETRLRKALLAGQLADPQRITASVDDLSSLSSRTLADAGGSRGCRRSHCRTHHLPRGRRGAQRRCRRPHCSHQRCGRQHAQTGAI